jgi:hypothetical protein
MLELLGGLSLVTDIGTGSPLEESLKRCLVATRLARIMGCSDAEVSDVLYTALLQHLGCTAYAQENGKRLDGFGEEALAALSAHSWPGNVRELENAIERAVVLARGTTITPEDMLLEQPRGADVHAADGTLQECLDAAAAAIVKNCLRFILPLLKRPRRSS